MTILEKYAEMNGYRSWESSQTKWFIEIHALYIRNNAMLQSVLWGIIYLDSITDTKASPHYHWDFVLLGNLFPSLWKCILYLRSEIHMYIELLFFVILIIIYYVILDIYYIYIVKHLFFVIYIQKKIDNSLKYPQ